MICLCWNAGMEPATAQRYIKTTQDLQERIVLTGAIEYTMSPKIEEFAQRIAEQDLPCCVKSSMPRLLRIADDTYMRRTVWRRMKCHELYWVSARDLSRVEAIAEACNMPLAH